MGERQRENGVCAGGDGTVGKRHSDGRRDNGRRDNGQGDNGQGDSGRRDASRGTRATRQIFKATGFVALATAILAACGTAESQGQQAPATPPPAAGSACAGEAADCTVVGTPDVDDDGNPDSVSTIMGPCRSDGKYKKLCDFTVRASTAAGVTTAYGTTVEDYIDEGNWGLPRPPIATRWVGSSDINGGGDDLVFLSSQSRGDMGGGNNYLVITWHDGGLVTLNPPVDGAMYSDASLWKTGLYNGDVAASVKCVDEGAVSIGSSDLTPTTQFFNTQATWNDSRDAWDSAPKVQVQVPPATEEFDCPGLMDVPATGSYG